MTKHLILFGFSGFDAPRVSELTTTVATLEDPAIVLMQDAIIGSHTVEPYHDLLSKSTPIYVLKEDLEARGFATDKIAAGMTPVTYLELVDLIDAAEKVISWL